MCLQVLPISAVIVWVAAVICAGFPATFGAATRPRHLFSNPVPEEVVLALLTRQIGEDLPVNMTPPQTVQILRATAAVTLIAAVLVSPLRAENETEFETAVAAYRRGEFVTAHAHFGSLAGKGEPRAQSIVALMYRYGEGVPRDCEKAAHWYKKAALQGYAVAQFSLAEMYAVSSCVAKDPIEARRWFHEARSNGHPGASSWLEKLDEEYSESSRSRAEPVRDTRPEERASAQKTVADVGRRQDSDEAALASRLLRKLLPANVLASLEAAGRFGVTSRTDVQSRQRPLVTHAPDSCEAPQGTKTPLVTESSSSGAAIPVAFASARAILQDLADSPATQPPPQGARSASEHAGSWMVQLGAFPSDKKITCLWSRIRAQHPDVIDGLRANVLKADLGPSRGVRYRLLVGPTTNGLRARRLCEALHEQSLGSGCFPVALGFSRHGG